MRGSDTVDIENRLESLITRVGEKVCLESICLYILALTDLQGFLFSCYAFSSNHITRANDTTDVKNIYRCLK